VDGALRALGARLAARFPGEALVARLGPDELAVAFRDPPAEDRVRALREALDAASAAGDAGGYSISNEYTIGSAADAGPAVDGEDLLRRAERALRYALRRGERQQVYDQALDGHFERYHTRYERLRQLLLGDAPDAAGLQLHYQPLVQLATGAVCGAEALARWVDPAEGPVSPDQFIPIIEGTGLLTPFTQFAVRRAVRDGAAWQRVLPGVPVSVNLSAEALVEEAVIDALEAAVRKEGLDPSLVHVEVTETALLRNPAAALAMMERLVAQGIHLAIDDYGTGYSSLSYLRQLPAQSLKIDQAFIREMDGAPRVQAIVDSTIALAHNLGMRVVAEGVETAEAEARLQALRCDVAQGWRYARALPVDQFRAWAVARRASAAA